MTKRHKTRRYKILSFFIMSFFSIMVTALALAQTTNTNMPTSTTTPPIQTPPATTPPAMQPMFPSLPLLPSTQSNFPAKLNLGNKEWILKGSSSVGLAAVAMYGPSDESTNTLGEQMIIKKYNIPVPKQINPATFNQ